VGTSTIGRELFAESFPPTIMTSTFISPAKNDAHLRIQIDDEDDSDIETIA